MKDDLTKPVARRIIESVGGPGEPPPYGFQFFSAGLGPYLQTLDEEYLTDFVRDGGSAFKMIVGEYGGGKTHFLYSLQELAWKSNYVVSYIELSPQHTPFHKLELVYQQIVKNLQYPQSPEELLSGYERGISAALKAWFATKMADLLAEGVDSEGISQELALYVASLPDFDSISFGRAIKSAFMSLAEDSDDDFENVVQWLKGEGFVRAVHAPYGILQKIDKTTAFSMIRSLVQWARAIGYSGLVVLMDEGERASSLTSGQRDVLLNNLRELIDECGHAHFKHAFFVYAVPDETFLEGRAQIYVALNQRLATIFDIPNPAGVKIFLDKIWSDPVERLQEIGIKLADIYQIAYDVTFDDARKADVVNRVAEAAYEQRFAAEGFKRLFVQSIVKALGLMRSNLPVELKELGLEAEG